MGAVTPLEQERAEMELVLRSGVFDKAPRLEKFFRYICLRYFEGEADRIKEYSIAVEALGRPPEFDPKKDSIVRVEAHRLRKRLEDYYSGPGATDSIRISIPCGQYRPQFLAGPPPTPLPLAPPLSEEQVYTAPEPAAAPPTASGARRMWRPYTLLGGAAAAAAVLILVLVHHRTPAAAAPVQASEEVWTGPTREPVSAEFRILAGYHGNPVEDRQGHIWAADAYYTGGVSSALPADRFIEAQPDPTLLRSKRSGRFHYDIPLRRSTYELRLYFAETDYGAGNSNSGEGSRIFQVAMNGQPVLQIFDPLTEAGSANRLHIRVFKDVMPAADGKLHLAFDPISPAFVNAIEILPSTPGRIQPIRIVTQSAPVTDSEGKLWAADEFFSGGMTITRRNLIVNSPEKALYQGERYGNFSYFLPLAPGKYRLTLHFAETWFGSEESQAPSLNGRLFNVFANGVALLRNYEIAQDAGGSFRAVSKVFDDLQPNAQGMIRLEFVPVKNYAEVNAIEVVETE